MKLATELNLPDLAVRLIKAGGIMRIKDGNGNGYKSFNDEELLQEILAARAALEPHIIFDIDHNRICIKPVVEMGATLSFPNESYPYEIVFVSPDGRKASVREMAAELDKSFKPDFHPGGFVGHVSNQHEQKWHYTSVPTNKVRTIRLNKRGWEDKGMPFRVGYASRFYDYNL
jgi:hypothetical protein